MSSRRILNVGQCGFDHSTISRYLTKGFDAEVARADDFDEAVAKLKGGGPYDLVLVNRVTDSDGSMGLDLIRTLKADAELAEVPVMLVSNHADAQQAAIGLGAVPGFGKADVGGAKADAILKGLLG